MEKWVKTFENWEVCDSVSMGLFAKSDFALPKILEWTKRKPEFEKRVYEKIPKPDFIHLKSIAYKGFLYIKTLNFE